MDNYRQEVVTELEKIVPSNVEVSTNDVTKDNGVVYHGITIREKDKNIAPTIYIEGFYERSVEAEDAAKEILSIYEKNCRPSFDFDVNDALSFDKIKDKVVFKLVNAEKNKEAFKDSPTVTFGDLLLTFRIFINAETSEEGIGSIKVTNNIFNSWNVTLEDLINVAVENAKRLYPISIKTMREILKIMYTKIRMTEEEFDMAFPESQFNMPLYVVSNSIYMNGAWYLTDRETLDYIAKETKLEEFAILPSSVHEFIVLSHDIDVDLNALINMVREVNSTQVSPEEVLSDNVYTYNSKTGLFEDFNGNIIPFVY